MHRNHLHAELRKAENSEVVYQDIKDRIPVATERAVTLRARYSKITGDQPYTDVDLLTGELLKIAGRLQ
jgi:hypothetical protein